MLQYNNLFETHVRPCFPVFSKSLDVCSGSSEKSWSWTYKYTIRGLKLQGSNSFPWLYYYQKFSVKTCRYKYLKARLLFSLNQTSSWHFDLVSYEKLIYFLADTHIIFSFRSSYFGMHCLMNILEVVCKSKHGIFLTVLAFYKALDF